MTPIILKQWMNELMKAWVRILPGQDLQVYTVPKTAMRIKLSSTLHGQHGQFRVINKAMKMTATNMTSGIFLEYIKGHTQ